VHTDLQICGPAVAYLTFRNSAWRSVFLENESRDGVKVPLGCFAGKGCRDDCTSGVFAWIDGVVDTERCLLSLHSRAGGGPTLWQFAGGSKAR
jgi:hypothetical protein